MPTKPAKAMTLHSRLKRDRALEERYGQRPYMGQVYSWMMKAPCGPEFGPPVRLERIRGDSSKRRALLLGDGQMQESMGDQVCIGALDIHDRKPLEALEEALDWFPVERHNVVLTVAFIKATAVPFERRSPREHAVVALYSHSGLSLDVVMKFEDGKATLAELERAPRLPEIHSRSRSESEKADLPVRRDFEQGACASGSKQPRPGSGRPLKNAQGFGDIGLICIPIPGRC
ncbi:hypothetical protein MBM_04512 [Drepanopeziza brunnea f. sp. 'multigermtubi' MB_m1]|uniref:Uncharacterized protein n=1 Tax=Marssonina brunnea f. sp. multigermtubi (strain MB_m1) TaxID=1072389 RepID=K1WH62_MARBU|nr:uncharacterized protein MBM_04512 [Drepanopeziza brunnea f. sp. 'multigermtubi' MB_m1]EKD16935.1 hypothetical protein MBM_04512 [Drepanopeziza brunnea f. sp. 'multigermtubi' MB_m1]